MYKQKKKQYRPDTGVDDTPVRLQQGACLVHHFQLLPFPIAKPWSTIRLMATCRIVPRGYLAPVAEVLLMAPSRIVIRGHLVLWAILRVHQVSGFIGETRFAPLQPTPPPATESLFMDRFVVPRRSVG